MLAILFHAYWLRLRVPSALGRKGPCSVIKPIIPLQPGPALQSKPWLTLEAKIAEDLGLQFESTYLHWSRTQEVHLLDQPQTQQTSNECTSQCWLG